MEQERNQLLLFILQSNSNLLSNNQSKQFIQDLNNDNLNVLSQINDIQYILQKINNKEPFDLLDKYPTLLSNDLNNSLDNLPSNSQLLSSSSSSSSLNNSGKVTPPLKLKSEKLRESTNSSSSSLLDDKDTNNDGSNLYPKIETTTTTKKPLPTTPTTPRKPLPTTPKDNIMNHEEEVKKERDTKKEEYIEFLRNKKITKEKERTNYFWKLNSTNEVKSISYEFLFILTNGFIDIYSNNKNDLNTVLGKIRNFCNVSKNDHIDMIKRMNGGLSNSIFGKEFLTIEVNEYSNAINKLLNSKSGKLFIKNNEMKNINFLLKLIESLIKTNTNNINTNCINRYLIIFYNCFIYTIYAKAKNSKNILNFSSFKEFKNYFLEQFENLYDNPKIENFKNINDLVTNLVTEYNLQNYEFVFPLNLKIYSFLSDINILNLLKDKNNYLEIPSEIIETLSVLRNYLNIDDNLNNICLIDSINRLENSSSGNIELQVLCNHYLLQSLQNIENYDKEEHLEYLKENSKVEIFYNNLIYNIYDKLNKYLNDFTFYFTMDDELFDIQLQAFIFLFKFIKNYENKSNNLDIQIVENITKLGMINQYERLQGFIFNKDDEDDLDDSDSNNDNLNNNKELTLEDLSKVSKQYIKLGNEILENLTYQKINIFPVLSNYYKNSLFESIYLILTMYCKELNYCLFQKYNLIKENIESYDILNLNSFFDIFKSFIETLKIDDDIDEEDTVLKAELVNYPYRLISCFEPVSKTIYDLFNKYFINEITNKYFSYIDNMIKLEKYEPINENVNYSNSVIDLFSFIRGLLPNLYQVIIPNGLEIYKQLFQIITGLIQRYSFLVTDDIPQSIEDFKIPNVEICERFHYHLLFVKLNNIITTRRNFIKIVKEMMEKSEELRSLFVNCTTNNKNNTVTGNMPSILINIDYYTNLECTSEILKDYIYQIGDIIACRNIFYELNENLFNELYLPNVSSVTFQNKFLEEYLEPCFENVVEMVDDPNAVEHIITKMFKHLMEALYDIIINGKLITTHVNASDSHSKNKLLSKIKKDSNQEHGRIFYPQDVTILLSDINTIEKFFYSEGEGITNFEIIRDGTKVLKNIVANIMDKKSEILINGGNGLSPYEKLPVTSSTSPFSKQIVYKVLKLRDDKAAKKFISKTKYPTN
ncbi:hypothetical protein ABK040_002344 [Willaertia magna]